MGWRGLDCARAATSNPAWLFRWYARGLHAGGRLVAGVGLPDTRIDEASIVAWGAWCEAQGLGCNHVLDRATTHADVLTLIAQCGRASPTWQTGRLGVVWEDRGRAATALITPGNIVAGTFGVEYAAGQTADEIAVRYIEPELDWQYNTLRRRVPGAAGGPGDPRAAGEPGDPRASGAPGDPRASGAPGDPRASGATVTATITLQGITDATQAAVECNLQAARQVYHRRRFGWEMAAEGLSIARGDVVHITHSLIDGGTAGRLAGGTAGRVTLNREVDPGDGRRARCSSACPTAGCTKALFRARRCTRRGERHGGRPRRAPAGGAGCRGRQRRSTPSGGSTMPTRRRCGRASSRSSPRPTGACASSPSTRWTPTMTPPIPI